MDSNKCFLLAIYSNIYLYPEIFSDIKKSTGIKYDYDMHVFVFTDNHTWLLILIRNYLRLSVGISGYQ